MLVLGCGFGYHSHLHGELRTTLQTGCTAKGPCWQRHFLPLELLEYGIAACDGSDRQSGRSGAS
jgi:hypothetical protein